MLVLVDAQVAPALAPWLRRTFDIEAVAVRDPGPREAEDQVIFAAAWERGPGTVVITKDSDFLDLLQRHGPPPQPSHPPSTTTAPDPRRDTRERQR